MHKLLTLVVKYGKLWTVTSTNQADGCLTFFNLLLPIGIGNSGDMKAPPAAAPVHKSSKN